MVIGENKTYMAYRCPACGGGVVGLCGDMMLAGGRLLKLKCPCGQSHMTAEETGDGKLRLTVPCLLCSGDHRYLVSKSVFYRGRFLLNCTYSNLDICFIGDEESVKKDLARNEKELRDLFTEAGLSTLANARREEEDALPETGALDVIRFLLRELEADGAVDCPCHDGEYEVAPVPGGVDVYCLRCNGVYHFPAKSVEAAQAYVTLDRLLLKEPHELKS